MGPPGPPGPPGIPGINPQEVAGRILNLMNGKSSKLKCSYVYLSTPFLFNKEHIA